MSLLARVVGVLPTSVIKAVSRAQWKHPLLRRSFGLIARLFRKQDGIIAKGLGKGLRFNAGNSNGGYLLGTSEPDVQEALAKLLKPGMVFFDIGANVGYLTILAARLVGPSGSVVAFDPVPDHAACIRRNAAMNRFEHVSVRPEAIGGENGVHRSW